MRVDHGVDRLKVRDDEFHVRLVAEYFRRSVGWDEPHAEQRPTPSPGDPLFAVWAHRSRIGNR